MKVKIIVISLLVIWGTLVLATQAQARDVTFHGQKQADGLCGYQITRTLGTHGKTVSNNQQDCTLVMDEEPGPATDAPPKGTQGIQRVIQSNKPISNSAHDPETTGHYQVWNWDPVYGTAAADTSMTSNLTWDWNGAQITQGVYWSNYWANDALDVVWNLSWQRNLYIWYADYNLTIDTYGQFYGHLVSGDFEPPTPGWYVYYHYVDFTGSPDGSGSCTAYVEPTFASDLGDDCRLDSLNFNPGEDILPSGAMLVPGQRLYSSDLRFFLDYQTNGNLVLYQDGVGILWASNTITSPGYAYMQPDGNLVLYDAWGNYYWLSHTVSPGAWLYLLSNGNLVIYNTAGYPIWATNTCCR